MLRPVFTLDEYPLCCPTKIREFAHALNAIYMKAVVLIDLS